MNIVRWNPARDHVSFENDMNQLFRTLWENAEPASLAVANSFMPALDVSETKEGYRVTAELPGLNQEDVNVSVVENALVIKGEKKSEVETKDVEGKGAYRHRIERRYGSFERILQLAAKVDKDRITATLKNGVLEIHIPKTEEARERQIQVTVK